MIFMATVVYTAGVLNSSLYAEEFGAAIGAVANDMKLAVFRRFAVMRHWISRGQ